MSLTIRRHRAPNLSVHSSPIAGVWHPADMQELTQEIEALFSSAGTRPEGAERVWAVISPHAGYRYSGRTAARAIDLLAGRETAIRRLILIGPSHRACFHGLSIGRFSAYRTPLGEVPVDLDAVEVLRDCPLVQCIDEAHELEHCLDIQLPLLQYRFGEAMPAIVPAVLSEIRNGDYKMLAGAFQSILDDETAILISSDFTHYGPNFGFEPFPPGEDVPGRLRELAGRARDAIRAGRREFEGYLTETGDTICGRKAIGLLLEMRPSGVEAIELQYANSAETTGDYSGCVSYLAMGFLRPEPGDGGAAPFLTETQELALLELARASVEATARGRKLPDVDALLAQSPMGETRAVFVTIRRNGELRGCIGTLTGIDPLAEAVRNQARAAAIHDPRFPAVATAELDELTYEISILSDPVPVSGPSDIELGRHGIILHYESSRAVFLPQVPSQMGWDLERTLSHLAIKAGLPSQTWRDPGAHFEVFEAIGVGK